MLRGPSFSQTPTLHETPDEHQPYAKGQGHEKVCLGRISTQKEHGHEIPRLCFLGFRGVGSLRCGLGFGVKGSGLGFRL